MPEPLTAAAVVTSITLVDFGIGIVGNWLARHLDPAENSLAKMIYDRLGKGGLSLPPNHDVERACRDSLRQALKMMAKAIELQVQRPKTVVDAIHNRLSKHGRWYHTSEGEWFDEFVRKIESDDSILQFCLNITDASSLNQSVRNLSDAPLEGLFRKTLLDWTQNWVTVGTQPACFAEFVEQGWPIEMNTPGVRVTLYKVWCLFLQDHIKKDEKVFRILTADWLASIDSRLKDISPDDIIAAFQEPLGDLRDTLVNRLDRLRGEVAGLSDQLGGMAISLGELLSLVSEYHLDLDKNFDSLRALLIKQGDQLADVREDTSAIRGDTSKLLENDAAILRKLDRTATPAEPPRKPQQLPPAAVSGVLYGRLSECNQLTKWLQEAKRATVVGPAGYGKTALAAKAVEAVVGRTPETLAVSPFSDGVVFLDLYASHAHAESVWHALANAVCGPEFEDQLPARQRAERACLKRKLLVIIEGGEEADGQAGRAKLRELLGVLSPENGCLLLTREITQAGSLPTIRLDKPLSLQEAGQLFDKLTRKRVQGDVRDRLLKLLEGHPLGLTWAGGLLAREDESPESLAKDWEKDTTRNLSDPANAEHTLEWLFGRSVKGLNDTAKQVLAAAGLLARAPFPIEAVGWALLPVPASFNSSLDQAAQSNPDGQECPSYDERSLRAAFSQLIDCGLLRLHDKVAELREFTHVLGYRFARDERASAVGLRRGLAKWLHQRLSQSLTVGTSSTNDLPTLLQHATALLRTDHDQQLWRPLAYFLLYVGCDRLTSLGNLSGVSEVLRAVHNWQDCLPPDKATKPDWQRERSVVFGRLGDLATAQGNLPEAQRLFSESLRIAQRLAESDSANVTWQRDLSVLISKFGDLASAKGKLPESQLLCDDAHRITQRLAESDPDNAGWQRDLYVSFGRLGDLASAQGKLPESQLIWDDALRIAQRLAESDPDNAEWQRDLSVSFNTLGDLAKAQGNLPEAQRLFGEQHRIAQRLAESDPTNAAWQRDLSVSFGRLGVLASAQGNLPEAQRLFGQTLRIAQRLAESDLDNAGWQRDLSVSFNRLGDLATAQGDLSEAQRLFSEQHRIAQRLAESDPDNAGWQRDLSVSFNKLGDLATAQENLPEAQRLFGESLCIRQRLAESDPVNAAWQLALSESHYKLAMHANASGDEEGSVVEQRKCFLVLQRMQQRGMYFHPQMAQAYQQLNQIFGDKSQ